jgi:plasmid stabilization system protein ParE
LALPGVPLPALPWNIENKLLINSEMLSWESISVAFTWRNVMPRGSKAKYSRKQKRQAEHIEESYEKRGLSKRRAEQRAWQTVNKQSGGGETSGGGRRASSSAKRAAKKESGQRAALSRKTGSSRVQKKPARHKASQQS